MGQDCALRYLFLALQVHLLAGEGEQMPSCPGFKSEKAAGFLHQTGPH